jgi:ATP-dependent DNA helicase PIF1
LERLISVPELRMFADDNIMIRRPAKEIEKEPIELPAGFRLDEDIAWAYHLMEFVGDSLFITGKAGTGKSTLLNYFRKNTTKKFVVLAPTGLAALHVGGSTIHSFFGLPLRPILKNDPDIKGWSKGHPRYRILQKMDTLIIDEVSMVRADIMDAIDLSMRLTLDDERPFGGKQVVLIGDVFQLSPVLTAAEGENFDTYSNPYFFSSDAFQSQSFKILELKKIYRQLDEDFIFLLNRIRNGTAGNDELDELNKRHSPAIEAQDFVINLSTINSLADAVNQKKLNELSYPGITYKGKVERSFQERLFPASLQLTLKIGAQIMMVKNDLLGRWVNGSIGKIENISENEIMVRFANGAIHLVETVTWENKTYQWDAGKHTITTEILGTYTQYPIKLAWAITIHKSQGLTFDNVIIDMGKGAFAHGQLYVALSRCKTLSGITLKTKLKLQDMIVDEAVERFAYTSMRSR